MVLFEHPINVAREKNGELPINSIWFWGGGRLSTISSPQVASVWSDDITSLSLAAKANIEVHVAPPDAYSLLAQLKDCKDSSTHMIVINHLESAMQYGDVYMWQNVLKHLDEQWFTPLLMELKKGHFRKLTIMGYGDHASIEINVVKRDLWKFWRSPRSLSDVLS
jgi:hypothetical protein